ncbi:stage III sporulation protein AG [Bacillus benzoevorans]|uniref:Stage III sporulation protein AG n=1 Tax=Bacillus benzoevorans TaxID=1456 RepID=A0A7X0HQ52_9BACI|nr:stage III sporulation protein AG [Bacillus benzoevorans]MBB6444878.1 stage III sporulation protein AG [Bacillus benzoevorans]
MKEDKGPFSWLKKQDAKVERVEKKKGKYPYLILLLLFGAGIMLLSNVVRPNGSAKEDVPVFNQQDEREERASEVFANKKSSGNSEIESYEQAYENQLKEALDTIVGVSDVTVVVNVDATEKRILEKNAKSQNQVTEETDREGGKRNVEDHSTDDQLVIIQDGEKEVPIVIETKKPAIRGVLVVANGADNIQVKKWIIEAVTRVLDVPSHRVSVLPKKTKGDS